MGPAAVSPTELLQGGSAVSTPRRPDAAVCYGHPEALIIKHDSATERSCVCNTAFAASSLVGNSASSVTLSAAHVRKVATNSRARRALPDWGARVTPAMRCFLDSSAIAHPPFEHQPSGPSSSSSKLVGNVEPSDRRRRKYKVRP